VAGCAAGHIVMIRDVAAGVSYVVHVENWFPELLANVRSRFYRAPGGAYFPIQSRTCSYQ
jgi:hypothetical protein